MSTFATRMNYEERIPLNSLQSNQRISHHESNPSRVNSRQLPGLTLTTEGSRDILEHLISIVLQGNASYLENLLKNEEVLDVIDMQDNKGFTALHIACDRYDPDCTRLLLQAGADPNVLDRYKRSALHWVVNGGCRCDNCNTRRSKCTELLVFAKVNLEIEDYEGETALYYAARNTLHKPASVMLEAGAEISRWANGVSLGHLIVQKIPEVMTQFLDDCIAYDDHNNSKLKIDFGVLIDGPRKNDDIGIGFEETKRPVRDANVKPRKETDILEYMMSAHPEGREELLTHPIVQAFLHLKWLYVRKFFWTTRIFYCLLTLVYTYFIFDLYIFSCPYYKTWKSDGLNPQFVCKHSFESYILAICIGSGAILMIFSQVYEFIRSPRRYLCSVSNLGWWVLIASISVTIIPPLELIPNYEWQYLVAAFGLFITWSMNLTHLNHLPYFGVYIEMLWKVLQKLIIVAGTFLSLFIAFALGFCLLFPKNELFNQIPSSLMKTLLIMLGDRDYPEVFNPLQDDRISLPQYAISAHSFYFIFLLTFGVVILNLLIALAVSDVQKLQKYAELSRVCRQITEIAVLESFVAGKCLSSCFTRCFLGIISVRTRNGRYFSFSPTDPDDKSLPAEIKAKFIPFMKSRPCLNVNRDKMGRPVLGSHSFRHQNGTGSNVGHFFTPMRTQENLDDILNELRNRLEGLNYSNRLRNFRY